MQYLLLVYIDHDLLNALPAGQFDGMMRDCLSHADALKQDGRLIESQMLEDAPTARSIRVREGKLRTTDGPFAETKEVMGGFNLIEAADLEEATRIAVQNFPWASVGCIEVRPVRDIGKVAERVGKGRKAQG